MDDQFFSLDSLLSDAYVDAVNEGLFARSLQLAHIRWGIEQENNS